MSQARFQKNQRERKRKEKAAAKRERRAARMEEAATAAAEAETEGAPAKEPQEDVLAELAKLHDQFEAGTVKFDEFEERKQELLARLNVQ